MNVAAIPYGYMECTDEKFPQIITVNQLMFQYLNLTEESPEWKNFYKENIYFMLPFDEREVFRQQLYAVKDASDPICVRHQLIGRNQDISSYLIWIKYNSDPPVNPYYGLFYTKESAVQADSPAKENTYLHALKNAYDFIFECHLSEGTVECVNGKISSAVSPLYNLQMTIDSGKSFWLNQFIVEEDRPGLNAFFDRITTPAELMISQEPLQIEFHVHRKDQSIHRFFAIAVPKDSITIFLCLKDVSAVSDSTLLFDEISTYHMFCSQLEDYIHLAHHVIGEMIFRMSDNNVYPTYVSQELKVRLFITQEEYFRSITAGMTKEEFLKRMTVSEADFEKLMNGHTLTVPFSNSDNLADRSDDQLLICCNKYGTDKNLFYELILKNKKIYTSSDIPANGIYARTFGHFDVFKDGTPIRFSNAKEKELLAILIDRNGGTLTSKEGMGILWPKEVQTDALKSRYRKTALTLKRTLEKYGISHIVFSKNGTRNIKVNELVCDYYELLNKNEKYISNFNNSYMSEYSWAEETLATLWKYS